ncbi:MAG TPA: DUF547 domain-containing protein [Flavisolibacter sp.]|nr:DUF547 domain-containing protein [Flavisolibacter sp.]
MTSNKRSSNKVIALSQDLLYRKKTGEPAGEIVSALAQLAEEDLKQALKTDDEKKAFWINLYNGFTQVKLQADPGQYKNRSSFFKKRDIEVAGMHFSLDDIEHGILRRSRIKWSLGYLGKLFPSGTEKALRVDRLDYRIHFALNCGAKSCPPIAYYSDELLQSQLDLATRAYLKNESGYDPVKQTVRLPRLMSWFRADFGGKKGIKNILRQQGIVPAGINPVIKFNRYDWTLSTGNYTDLDS